MKQYCHDSVVHNTLSAEQVVPYILNILAVDSIIDLGCGFGSWLKVFQDNGVGKIVGINEYKIPNNQLYISQNEIIVHDLNNSIAFPGTFDLAISLEVAEHLRPESASNHVAQLVELSEWILFSAAIPGQGGQNHLNEQWVGFWQNLFKTYDYYFWDILRPKFWDNDDVLWWYKQNMFLVGKKDALLQKDSGALSKPILNLVHPQLFELRLEKIKDLENSGAFFKRMRRRFFKH